MSTYSQVYLHIVFSVQNRSPLIRDEWKILGQVAHHKTKSSYDEYKEFLDKLEIEYDNKYLN